MRKGKFDFNVSNLMGAHPSILRALQKKFTIDKEFRWKWKKSTALSSLLSILAIADRWRSKRALRASKIERPPVFIIGHWRSGTTHLHNLMSLDDDAAFPTTYQTVFPNNLFAFQAVIKWFMKIFIPAERPGDGLPLRADQPQEEEFGIGNTIDLCFYYWMFFPREAAYFRDVYLSEKKMTAEMEAVWKDNYLTFVKRTLLNSGKKTFVSKNPPNTARIHWLLDLFPDAKFIFIHRNPYAVYYSTQKFFRGVLPTLQFQNVSTELFDEHILASYVLLHQSYFENKKLIPKENLIEIRYDQLITNPDSVLRDISIQFKFPDLAKVNRHMRDSGTEKKHKVDQYKMDETTILKINERWRAIFTKLGYSARTE